MTSKTSPTFSNPFWQDSFPDPFVLKVRGRYYAYATTNERTPSLDVQVFPILSSDDLIHWRFVGHAMASFGPPYHSYWAPEVTEYNGRFYLYYAVHYADEFRGAIRVAVADQPEGPFIDSGYDLTSALLPWAIDPHIFRDQDGQWYLFMTIEYLDNPTGFVGSGNAVVRLQDPFTPEGPLTRVTAPSHAWQLFEAKRQTKGGIDWYTVEGPAVLRHRNRYYEMYSGGCYFRNNYAVSYAVSDTPMGPDGMKDSSWQDWPGNERQEVLLSAQSGQILGPGHNSVVLGLNNADLYMAYHAWPADMSARRPFLDRLFWHGNELWTPAPTLLSQPVPVQPALRELFNDPVFDPGWQQLSGDWYLAPGEVIQNDPSPEQFLLQQNLPLDSSWLLEVHIRLIAGKGSYGLLLDGKNDTIVSIASVLEHHIGIWTSTAPTEPLHLISLKSDFDPFVWHRLFLRYSGSLLQIQLDGIPLLALPVSEPAKTFALRTEACSAAFSGITLTHHFCDEFLDAQYTPDFLGWRPALTPHIQPTNSADWQIQDQALVQTSLEAVDHFLLKGSPQISCEFAATLQLRPSAPDSQAVLGLALFDGSNMLKTCLSQNGSGWKIIVEGSDANTPFDAGHELPTAFNPYSWHTLRLILTKDQLELYLDGPWVFSLALPSASYTCGLFTENASVAFIGVWQTTLG